MHSLLSQIYSISYSVGLSFGIRDASLVNSRQPRWLALICLRGLLNTDQGNRNAYFIAFNSTVLRRCRHNLSTVHALPRSCQHGMGKKTRIPRLQNLSTSLDAVSTINSVWFDSTSACVRTRLGEDFLLTRVFVLCLCGPLPHVPHIIIRLLLLLRAFI